MIVRRPFFSHLGLTYDEVMRLPVSRKNALLERLGEDWRKEAKK